MSEEIKQTELVSTFRKIGWVDGGEPALSAENLGVYDDTFDDVVNHDLPFVMDTINDLSDSVKAEMDQLKEDHLTWKKF